MPAWETIVLALIAIIPATIAAIMSTKGHTVSVNTEKKVDTLVNGKNGNA